MTLPSFPICIILFAFSFPKEGERSEQRIFLPLSISRKNNGLLPRVKYRASKAAGPAPRKRKDRERKWEVGATNKGRVQQLLVEPKVLTSHKPFSLSLSSLSSPLQSLTSISSSSFRDLQVSPPPHPPGPGAALRSAGGGDDQRETDGRAKKTRGDQMATDSSVLEASSESIAQKMGFFRVPDLLVKLSTKCLSELDAVRSPTSPLDLKFFTGLGTKSPRSSSLDASQNQKILLGDRVGLGIVDSLTDESPTTLGGRKVLLGSEMRITDNLSRKNSSTAPVQAEEVEQKDDNMSDGLKGSVMSLDDIVNSEDYTCVVSRGPNPRTTHIFGDRVFELQVEQLMPGESKDEENISPVVEEGAMSFCSFCSEKLKDGKDIYIYQGDKAFCSTECRENFMEDEMEEGEPMIYHSAPPSSSPLDNGPIFQLIR